MELNPLRQFRRWRRIEREAIEEAALLRRRHGELALTEADRMLARADLTHRFRRVMARARQRLERGET